MSASKLINYSVSPGGSINGELVVPGDKSISHRSIMFGSLADGKTHIKGFLEGEDSLATLNAFAAMGVSIEGPNNGNVIIQGVGIDGLKEPTKDLDLGNSGTSMRLMSGLLSGQRFQSVLKGDASLSTRPMKRVTAPLADMGAKIDSSDGKAPLSIHAKENLSGIHYDMPIASAQVKSCLLLAGMYAEGTTSVSEPGITRDHTERMLKAFGYPLLIEENKVSIKGGQRLTACDLHVPSDISSAAFFMVAASIAENSSLLLKNVGVNPTRTGVIDILRLMGANIELHNERLFGDEPVADIRIKSAELKGIQIPEALVPLAIDEFPAIFVAASCATGKTTLTGARELRVKESDRIQVMVDGLQTLGINIVATDDGAIIEGGQLTSGTVESHDDHRIAMSFAMAGLRANGLINIRNCANVATSFPGFIEVAERAGLSITQSIEEIHD